VLVSLGLLYYVFLLALILIFSVLAKKLAGKHVSDITYLVSRGTLKLNSINRSINQSINQSISLGNILPSRKSADTKATTILAAAAAAVFHTRS